MVSIRTAVVDDTALLSDLAIRSKGYWGYDRAFLDACRDELAVDAARLRREIVRVAETEAGVVGFSSLTIDGDRAELVALFVDPDHVGTGIGGALLDDAIVIARSRGVHRLRIESDPHAADWYKRRGAVVVGRVPSLSIPDRTLPLLELPLV